MKKRSVVIVVAIALVLVLGLAGTASAGKTVYWDRTAEITTGLNSASALQIQWSEVATYDGFDHYATYCYGPGDYDAYQSNLGTTLWYPFGDTTPAPSGAYRIKILACDVSGRVLDRLQTRMVIP